MKKSSLLLPLIILLFSLIVFVMSTASWSHIFLRDGKNISSKATIFDHSTNHAPNLKDSDNNESPPTKNKPANPKQSSDTESHEWISASTDPKSHLYISEMNFSRYQKTVGPPKRDEESYYALKHGARSKLTIRIVDESGNAVSGARVSVFHCRGIKLVKTQRFTTGTDATIVVENKNADEYQISVEKQGYYGYLGQIQFYSQYNRCVENGRWIPWNPHVNLILKSIDNPISLRDYDISIRDDNLAIPLDTDIPFDLLSGDFLPPFGKGMSTNLFIRVSGYEQGRDGHVKTVLHFPSGGGLSKHPKDGFCDYMYPKRINQMDFSDEFVHEKKWMYNNGFPTMIDTDPTGREYIALRVPETLPDGSRTFRYGILYDIPRIHIREDGKGFYSFCVRYFLNPEPGNSNVEAPIQLRK